MLESHQSEKSGAQKGENTKETQAELATFLRCEPRRCKQSSKYVQVSYGTSISAKQAFYMDKNSAIKINAIRFLHLCMSAFVVKEILNDS